MSGKVPPIGFYNTNISSSGWQAMNDAGTVLWDEQWIEVMKKIVTESQPYGHDCGTVLGNASKSKDQAAVESLNVLKDRANNIQGYLKNFLKNIYYNGNNGAYKERMRVINGIVENGQVTVMTNSFLDINGSHVFLTPEEVSVRREIEEEKTKRIARDVETEKTRKEYQIQRRNDLDTSQDTIKQEFANTKRKLKNRITELNDQNTDAKSVKNDRNSKKGILIDLKQKTEDQKNISEAVSTSLASAAVVSKQQLSYLTDRVTSTQNLAVDGYEELYKAVILQNNLLEVANVEMNSNISTNQRKSEFVSNKKTFVYDIYIKLYTVYYILILFFIVFLIFYKKLWSTYYKIFLIIAGLIYPLIILTAESWIYNSWLYVLSLLTGSVYVYRPL